MGLSISVAASGGSAIVAAFVLVVLACRVTAPAVQAIRSRPVGALAPL